MRPQGAISLATGGYGPGPYAALKARLAMQRAFRQGAVFRTINEGRDATRLAGHHTRELAQRPVSRGLTGRVDRRA